MTADVRDETGRNQDLAELITATLTDAIPVIETVTDLPLPQCTFRLVTPGAWRREVRAYVKRDLRGARGMPPLTPDEALKAELMEKRWRFAVRWGWPLMNGKTITTLEGAPETLICPRALHHTGLPKTVHGLRRFLIHESVHQGQIWRSAGLVVPPPLSPRPGPYNDRMVSALFEGHADWAEALVTHHLSGGRHWPVEETVRTSLHTPIRQGLVYARNRIAVRWEKARHGTTSAPPASRGELRAHLFRRSRPAHLVNPAFHFVRVTMPPSSGDQWNTIWTNPDLVPTQAEVDDPHLWLKRVDLAGSPGVPRTATSSTTNPTLPSTTPRRQP